MSRDEWVLLTLAAAKDEPVSPVVLQKSLFLLGQNYGDYLGSDYFAFTPYHYGPFSSEVYQVADALESAGMVTRQQTSGQRWSSYAITRAGLEQTRELQAAINASPTLSSAARYLSEVVAWASQLTFRQLVSKIYDLYPLYRENSIFQG